MGNKFKEIGSEFWLENIKREKDNGLKPFELGIDNRFLLSGRTAINFVLEDILKTREIKNVYFPSYCCDSMLQPFIEKNINIEFYDVIYEEELKYDIDLNKKCDVFFAMNYFGYTKTNMCKYIKNFKDKHIIVIEDITHSLLSDDNYCNRSDYLIASLRKWFPIITGGLACKINNRFLTNEKLDDNFQIIKKKKKAMNLKQKYISNQEKIKKEKFLSLYNLANDVLEKDYKNYTMDEKSLNILKRIDVNLIKTERRKNARTIYNILKNSKIHFLDPNLKEEDCLLFVPIMMEANLKEKLKAYLIKNDIYCPTHWKQPKLTKDNILYTNELSLICDQRYSTEEIERYTNLILKFMKEN